MGYPNLPGYLARQTVVKGRPSSGSSDPAAQPWLLAVQRGVALRRVLRLDYRGKNREDATIREVRSALARSDGFVYAIAIDSPDRQPINTRVNPQSLREITAESGGRTEVVRNSVQLNDATARIAEELNSQYVLGYTSPRGADGQYHTIRVRVTGTDDRVRARNGYVATPLGRHKSYD